MFKIEIINTIKNKPIGSVQVRYNMTVKQLKNDIAKLDKKLIPERQSIRLNSSGKALQDDFSLNFLGIEPGNKIYVKDLGPQIGWKTVFLLEYAGPLFIYLLMYQRPSLFYDSGIMVSTCSIACICWCVHYIKRLLETLFVHRFSHATMPFKNLFKNCLYYWLFALYVAYYINHPLYVEPSKLQVYLGLIGFIFAELGNLSIHLALRNLRPPGTTKRSIPNSTGNPFTFLFNYVSCPNYFYEFVAWICFSMMTQCVPALLFALAGMYQMVIWALDKHRNYKQDFLSYPRSRKAVIPFFL